MLDRTVYFLPIYGTYTLRASERTNNVVESYHGRWNSEVGVRHPNMSLLIRKMKDHQALAHNTLINAQNGLPWNVISTE